MAGDNSGYSRQRPMSHVFHRDARHDYPVAVAGDGVYLIDRDGRRYLDASGGAAVSCLGHSDRAVRDAIARQLAALPYAHTSFFTNEPMETLAERLVATAPAPLDKVYFTAGGAEAMEAALKLARQYFVERGEPERVHFIARRQSYHGNSLGALAVGGNRSRRAPFEPLLIPPRMSRRVTRIATGDRANPTWRTWSAWWRSSSARSSASTPK